MAAYTSVRRRTGTVDISKAVNHRESAFLAPGRHDRSTIRLEVLFLFGDACEPHSRPMGDQRPPQKSPPQVFCDCGDVLFFCWVKVHFMYDSVRGGDDRVHDELISCSFRVPWPPKYHHARALAGCCKGISTSACQRRAHEFVTQRAANPSPDPLTLTLLPSATTRADGRW